MNSEAALKRKLHSFQQRIDLMQALMEFMKNHPDVARRTTIWHLSNKVALQFAEKAFIRTVWTKDKKPALRLERYVEDWADEAGDVEKRVIHPDISELSRKELDEVLKKVQVNLALDEDDDEEPEWYKNAFSGD
jgi:hypothetical protein